MPINHNHKSISILLTLFLALITINGAIAATNQLGWSSAQAARWSKMRSQYHAMWRHLKAKADDPKVYADNGMQDGLVYLITGDLAYARSAYQTISHYADRNSSGTQPSRDHTRHNFGALALLYSWVADALPAADKAHFRGILEHWSDLVFDAKHGTRTVDSDEMTGHYFGLALFALAIRSEDRARSDALMSMDPSAWAPVGGFDATGVNRNSWRNTLSEYVKRAAGGAWLESSEYNLTTVRYLVEYSRMINAYFNQDKFPEITALIPAIEQTLIQEMTPGYRDSFQWGDVEEAHSLKPYHRISLLALIADSTGNPHAFDLYDTVFNNYPQSSSLDPHFYLFIDPYAARSPISGGTHHNAAGRGVAYYHSDWGNNDSFFGSWHQTITKVDHETGLASNFGLYRNGEWVLDYPRGYQISSAYSNTMLISGGIDTSKEAKGQIAYDAGADFLYHVGTTGGQLVYENYWDYPPEMLHEWTRSHLYVHNADQSDTIIVFDRINASNPLNDITSHQFGRIPSNYQGDISKANGRHQWIIHMDDASPVINGNTATWASQSGQKVHLKSFLSSNYSTAFYDESGMGLTGYIQPRELGFQLRLIPTQTKGWQTLLNVLNIGGPLNATPLNAKTGENAKGVLIKNSIDSMLAIFNADSGPLPYRINGNPVALKPTGSNNSGKAAHNPNRLHNLAQLHLFQSGFGIDVNTATPTKVYIADLNPNLKWVLSLNGNTRNLNVSSSGLVSFVITGGFRTIKVFSSEKSGLASKPILSPASIGTNTGSSSIPQTKPKKNPESNPSGKLNQQSRTKLKPKTKSKSNLFSDPGVRKAKQNFNKDFR